MSESLFDSKELALIVALFGHSPLAVQVRSNRAHLGLCVMPDCDAKGRQSNKAEDIVDGRDRLFRPHAVTNVGFQNVAKTGRRACGSDAVFGLILEVISLISQATHSEVFCSGIQTVRFEKNQWGCRVETRDELVVWHGTIRLAVLDEVPGNEIAVLVGAIAVDN